MNGLYGTKLGMTHYFTESGEQIPVTVVQTAPATVVQLITNEKHGYTAVQAGFFDSKEKHLNKPQKGVYANAGVANKKILGEFPLDAGSDLKAGDTWDASIFQDEKKIAVTAVSKGHGFSGTIKRYGFSSGPRTHGSHNKRAPGSTGACAYPGRVFPGQKLPGQYGNKRFTIKNLRLEKIDVEKGLLYIRGAVPGPKNGRILVKKV